LIEERLGLLIQVLGIAAVKEDGPGRNVRAMRRVPVHTLFGHDR